MSLLAGIGKQDITPPIGASLAGMPTARGSNRMHDPLWVRAIYFEQGDTRAVLLSMDLASLSPPYAEAQRKAIAEQLGIPLDAVVLCTTHTHFGPGREGWEGHEAYWGDVERKIVEAAQDAQRAALPVSVSYAASRRDDLSHNRRYVLADGSAVTHPGRKDDALHTDGPTDPEIQAVLVSDGQGHPLSVIAGFACHPTSMRWTDAISADYPYWIEQEVKQGLGDDVEMLFFCGALGDVADGDAQTRSQHSGSSLAEKIGSEVGREVVRALKTDVVEISGALSIASADASLPTLDMGPKRQAWAEEVLKTPEGRPGWQVRDARMILRIWREWPDEIQVKVPLIAFGELGFYGVPGELFCWYGLQLKAQSRFRYPFVLGLANGRIGYIADRVFPTKDSFNTPLNFAQRRFGDIDDAGERLVRAALDM